MALEGDSATKTHIPPLIPVSSLVNDTQEHFRAREALVYELDVQYLAIVWIMKHVDPLREGKTGRLRMDARCSL